MKISLPATAERTLRWLSRESGRSLSALVRSALWVYFLHLASDPTFASREDFLAHVQLALEDLSQTTERRAKRPKNISPRRSPKPSRRKDDLMAFLLGPDYDTSQGGATDAA